MLTREFFLKSWVLKITRSSKFFNFRRWIYNSADKFDIGLKLSILVFLFCLAATNPDILKALKNYNLMVSISFFVFPFIVVAFIVLKRKDFFMRNVDLIRKLLYGFLLNGDRVKILAKDERKNYTGTFIRLPDEELKRYLKNMKEKDLGFPKFSLLNIFETKEIVDLGAGLFAKIPSEAIISIEHKD